MANDTNSRIKSATRGEWVHRPDKKYVHGEQDEIAARVGGTIPSLPDSNPTSFTQIGPNAADTGRPSSRRPTTKSGNAKFGDARRYIG